MFAATQPSFLITWVLKTELGPRVYKAGTLVIGLLTKSS